MAIQPYLFFDGRCDEAIAFYQQALGAEVVMRMAFKDNPEPPPPGVLPPGLDDKVMHASLRIQGAELMCSDGMSLDGPKFSGFSVALALDKEEDVDRFCAALAQGGKVTMPPARTFHSARFAMVEDKFGLGWILDKS